MKQILLSTLWLFACLSCPLCWPLVGGALMFFGVDDYRIFFLVIMSLTTLGIILIFRECIKYKTGYLSLLGICIGLSQIIFARYMGSSFWASWYLQNIGMAMFIGCNLYNRYELSKKRKKCSHSYKCKIA